MVERVVDGTSVNCVNSGFIDVCTGSLIKLSCFHQT